MGKITFRADDDLVDELESFDVSKSEVMREALRTYLRRKGSSDSETTSQEAGPAQGHDDTPTDVESDGPMDVHLRISLSEEDGRATVDSAALRADDRVPPTGSRSPGAPGGQSGAPDRPTDARGPPSNDSRASNTRPTDRHTSSASTGSNAARAGESARGNVGDEIDCTGCGTAVDSSHVFCPNCGEKTNQRVFCACGVEINPDWAFCPACGRQTPAADVLGSR